LASEKSCAYRVAELDGELPTLGYFPWRLAKAGDGDEHGLPTGQRLDLPIEVGRRQSDLATVVRWITAGDNRPARSVYDAHATATPWVTYDMPPKS
jgi:hypothetical protein